MGIAGGYDIPGVEKIPTGILKFDEAGKCMAPDTRKTLLQAIADGGFSHIIFMSHGWNTDFADAMGQYGAFLKHFESVMDLAPDAAFRPVFIGTAWPSVWFPLDEGPAMAGTRASDAIGPVVAAVAEGEAADRLDTLLRQSKLSRAEVEEAVAIALPSLRRTAEDEVPEAAELQAEEVVRAVAHMQAAEEGPRLTGRPGAIGAGAPAIGEAQIAGGLDRLNPKHLLRLFSVYKMKDRAGAVGANGVAETLRMLAELDPPTHLAGHSFGAKVMLSALTGGPTPKKPVATALLLQPALSHLAFATSVKGRSGTGGYIGALKSDRVARSVFTTYSRGDRALHDLFHLALRRPADLGEIRIATAAGDPPSVYAALGGYGPRVSGETLVDPIRPPEAAYGDLLGKTLVGLDGSATIDWPTAKPQRRISSHGDVASPYTAWALFQQMRG